MQSVILSDTFRLRTDEVWRVLYFSMNELHLCLVGMTLASFAQACLSKMYLEKEQSSVYAGSEKESPWSK